MTIRERIRAIQAQVLAGPFTPAIAREHLMQLTALYGLVLDEHRLADFEYALTLLKFLESGEPVTRAEARAAVTPQYARVREARDIERLTLEMIRGCKVSLRSLDEEMALAK